MKKLINRPEAVVEEMVEGLVAIHPGLRKLPGFTVVVRADAAENRERQVALISGGGSGHEPAHAGYVGRGMLSAAVAGDVFTSPSPDSILAAIRAVAGRRGVLLIVKNYTGDRLNFGLAAELARAEGIPVEMVLVADDVALAESSEHAGRRGLAGTILVHKVAGAAAEAGLGLEDVAAEARGAADAVRTMGVALSPCTVPVAGKPGFSLGEQEVELGLGIHGEPGVRRIGIRPADELVDQMLDRILADAPVDMGDRVVLLVNNLCATPAMEQAIVARRALRVLEERGLAVERAYVGTFLSALEMAGISLSVLTVDDARLARLDAPTDAPAWPNAAAHPRTKSGPVVAEPAGRRDRGPPAPRGPAVSPPPVVRSFIGALDASVQALVEAAPRLDAMDQLVGDGDIGASMARGANAASAAVAERVEAATDPIDPATLLLVIGETLQRAMGGTSGPLYSVFFLRAGLRLKEGALEDAGNWAEAFMSGCQGIAELGGAAHGDRTMLDALMPAAAAFRRCIDEGRTAAEALRSAAAAASDGARSTADMKPRRGRSSYLGDRALGHPDPGAEAVAVWLGAIAKAAEN